MNGKFSERMGLKTPRVLAQVESMDDALRNGLWNVLYHLYFGSPDIDDDHLSKLIWWNYFKAPIDARPSEAGGYGATYDDNWKEVRAYFFNCQWFEVYDFVEFMVELDKNSVKLMQMLDSVLKKEGAGYRLIGGSFTPIVDPAEIDEVRAALANSFSESASHISSALALLADRTKPDYRNSIKESISAVEAAARIVSGKPQASLGDALKSLERSGSLHGSLKGAFSQLYGYTSDADGIRHSLMGESNITPPDARYFLIVCSAFVNLLKAKGTL